VVDTLGNAYLQQSAITSAGAAETAAVRKKQVQLIQLHHDFFPMSLETVGPMSVSTQDFLAQIGRRLTEVTMDPRKTTFLFQRLSVTVQRFNAACLADTFAISEPAS